MLWRDRAVVDTELYGIAQLLDRYMIQKAPHVGRSFISRVRAAQTGARYEVTAHFGSIPA